MKSYSYHWRLCFRMPLCQETDIIRRFSQLFKERILFAFFPSIANQKKVPNCTVIVPKLYLGTHILFIEFCSSTLGKTVGPVNAIGVCQWLLWSQDPTPCTRLLPVWKAPANFSGIVNELKGEDQDVFTWPKCCQGVLTYMTIRPLINSGKS